MVRQLLLIPLLFATYAANANDGVVDPNTHPKPDKEVTSENFMRDTTTIQLESGTVEIGRKCSDTENQAWTNGSLKLNATVMEEAQRKGIKRDIVWIEIKQDNNCNYSHFSIPEPGQLETLNEMARHFCAELIVMMQEENIENPFGCPTDQCENIQIPITLNLM